MRIGNWIQTFSGRTVYPLDLQPEDICIEDIAHALALKNRYTGHTLQFYSVADHCVWVSDRASLHNALWGLLHDAAEAYLPDVAGPIKQYVYFHLPNGKIVTFAGMEQRILAAVAIRFGLPPLTYGGEAAEEIYLIDKHMLSTERRDLMWPTNQEWSSDKYPAYEGIKITPRTWEAAETAFLRRWGFLRGGRE